MLQAFEREGEMKNIDISFQNKEYRNWKTNPSRMDVCVDILYGLYALNTLLN